MRYIWQHIQAIVDSYNGSVPLTHFLKSYCKQHPKLGSRDRRVLSDLAYCWYRCSKGLGDMPFEEKMLACLHFCRAVKTLKILAGSEVGEQSVECSADAIFPYPQHFSKGITSGEWLGSMLVQPSLFMRIRKDTDKITALLQQHEIAFSRITDTCYALPNGSKIENILPPASYVVQDASSQYTGSFFKPVAHQEWYDCCSGAGGKSLLLKDMEPGVKLTVSDVRQSILHNLKERFKLYNLKLNNAIVTDVADKVQLAKALGSQKFDNIICDVPCSGSGTWARTPEQLYFFDPVNQQKYPAWQKKIACNAAQYLKPGGRLIYITCSVFEEENEAVVAQVVQATDLIAESSQIINGVGMKADSMFVAVLSRK